MQNRRYHLPAGPVALLLAALLLAGLWDRGALRSSAEALSWPAAATETPAATEDPAAPLRGKLRITELMEKNRGCLRDADGDFPDWFELTNVSDESVPLAGCRVTDRERHWGWALPDRSLEPGERLLIFASKKNRREGELHADFALSEEESVYVYDVLGRLIDSAPCGGVEKDVSMALSAEGDWGPCLYPTPGHDNSPAGYEAYQRTLAAAGPLVISEAAVRNLGFNVAGTSSDCDWVELKNVSALPVRLSDYYLSERRDTPFLRRLPDLELDPGECTILVCESAVSGGNYGSTPLTGFSLSSVSEQLFLSDAAGELVDWISLRDIPSGGSCGRMDGQAGWYFFAAPTPGKPNEDGKRRVSAMPVCLSGDGVYNGPESVTMAFSGSGELRYTVNGGLPTEKSLLYSAPLELKKTCTVSVRCFEPDALPSRPLSVSCILNEGHSLPVVSFVPEDPLTFSQVYGGGAKEYELPGSLALYREDGGFNINCGVSLNGETSLSMTKKNLAVHFRGAYGEATLEHDIFGGGVCSFSSLLLRAGQDQNQAVIRNELAQSLVEKADTAVINQRSIFCALYLNGEYAGIYTLKERPNAALYASLAGVDRDSVEIVEAPAPYGSRLFEDTLGYVNRHDMQVSANYEEFCRSVDIDSLIDWLILEGFCANTDVTSGNLRYARSYEADGRWHLLFYDLDAAFRTAGSVQRNLLNGFGATNIQVAAFSVPLMQNRDFCDKFLSRAAELLRGPLSNRAILEEIDRMTEEIRTEVYRDFRRYNQDPESWERAVADLRSMITDYNWRQLNIDGLCATFELDDEQRAHYFGDIDTAPAR